MEYQLSESVNGAIFAVSAINDAGIIINAPRNCRFYHNAVTDRDFEPVFAYETLSYPEDYYVSAKDAAVAPFHTKGSFDEICKYIHRKDYQFVLVVNLPDAEITGKALAYKMKEALPRIPWTVIDSEHFTGSFSEGYQKAMIQTLHSLRLSMQLSRPKTVNLLGLNLTQRFYRSDRAVLEAIFEACGVEILSFGGMLDNVRALRKAALASLNLVICPEYGDKTAAYLKDTLSQEYRILKTGYPVGSEAVTAIVREICQYFDTDCETALEKLSSRRKREAYFLNRYGDAFKNHSFAIRGEASFVYAISRFLIRQTGMIPKALTITVDQPELKRQLAALLKDIHCEESLQADFNAVLADVYLSDGNTLENKCADFKTNPRCIPIAHPAEHTADLLERSLIGSGGGLFLMEAILKALHPFS